ncbi:MAG TPA: diacylglycerol kinase family protein [Actinomycetota bacterium]|nr:diacylglycerol kinase family protein [Actinomycetota bacterium]
MTRGLLVYNPEATSISRRVRDVIAHALAAEVKLEIAETKRRHHATHIAEGAAHEGYDVIFVLGGDGTVNEVVNGIAGSDVAIAHLPAGGTNVFARSLGLPEDPIEATSIVLERLEQNASPKRINLGTVNGRYFTFCAGIGFDADIVRAVERRSMLKKKVGQAFFVAEALRTFFFRYPRRDPQMTIRCAGETIDDALLAIVCNSDPYTFLGDRPFRAVPGASNEHGLSAITATKMSTIGTLRIVFKGFGKADHDAFPFVRALHDVGTFTVECARPFGYQVDGDFAGEDDHFEFVSMPRALSVIA